MFLLLCGLLFFEDRAETIQAPTGSKSAQLEVQAGGLVLRDGEAGAAFGTVRVGKDKRKLSYFIVVKHELGKAEKAEFNEDAELDNKKGKTKQTLSLDGKSVEIVYEVRLGDKEPGETVTINKETYDPKKKGRVFLLDLTGETPRWEQRKIDLPAEVGASNKKATEELAKKVLASVAAKDKKAKEFIEKAGK
jgi:hypothetical protein